MVFDISLFNAWKSTHNLIWPVVFQTGTRFETHSEYLTGNIILAFNNFSNSFLIVALSAGLIGLCFFLTGFTPSLIGMA
jgi:hypothetical protein